MLARAFAAISSLDSILAALSQTTLTALGRADGDPRTTLRTSRLLVLVYGVLLGAAAVGIDTVAERYASILDLALAMAGYTGGALLAAFFLAWWKPLFSTAPAFGRRLLRRCSACLHEVRRSSAWWVPRVALGSAPRAPLPVRSGPPFCSSALDCAGASAHGHATSPWPWCLPVGAVVAFAFGWLLDEQRDRACRGKIEAREQPGAERPRLRRSPPNLRRGTVDRGAGCLRTRSLLERGVVRCAEASAGEGMPCPYARLDGSNGGRAEGSHRTLLPQ